jgi:transcriptional regulator with XRE-family HTH domain
LAEFLRTRRERTIPTGRVLPEHPQHLRREEMAKLLGCDVQWYTRLEMGYPAYPLLPTLHRIAQVLGLDESETAELLALAEAADSGS